MDRHSQDGSEKNRIHHVINLIVKGSLTLLVLGIILGTFALAGLNRLVDQLELKSYDLRTQMQWGDPTKRPSPDVVILQFDDLSLNVLNDEFGVWPWPRDVHARMINFMNQAGVRSLLYDIMFVSYRKGDEKADASLVSAFQKNKNVYLSMNLDNELAQNQKLGKDLTPKDIELLKPLSIPLISELDKAPRDTTLKLQRNAKDNSVFFDNDHITFNHYRSIMPSLLEVGRNIAIINHGSDEDGVSRGNPLFFRFRYQPFIQSTALPIAQKGTHWFDAKGKRVDQEGYLIEKSAYLPVVKAKGNSYVDQRPNYPQPVDADGYLMDGYGHYVYQREPEYRYMYFPYLGMRAMLDLKFPDKTPTLKLTRDGHVQFAGYDIPLGSNGDYLVNWYNVNIKHEEYGNKLRDVVAFQKLLTEKLSAEQSELQQLQPDSKEYKRMLAAIKATQQDVRKAESVIQILESRLKSKYMPQPYKTISAWEVIRTMKKEEAGIPFNQEDKELKELLKDKIVFIGATAVGTYDIKNTSIHSTLPGVVLQANIFDNLYQNDGKYIHRVEPYINFLATVVICLLAAGCALRMKSPLAGLLTTANIAVLYVLFTIIMYQSQHLWVNVAMPMVCLLITITITFMLKYFFRNQDYEKTYALATTDSMTGLYNHRFFQEHMHRSIDQANRFKHKFSLLLIDIDFFKKFNDTYGHQAGDEVLRQVAKKLKKTVRTVDVVARYGGEEMAIILDRANEEEAMAVAQKVVSAIAEEAYPIAEGVAKHVTISCGVATFPTHGESPSQMIEFSDAGLYRAKENGRNQVGSQYDATPPDDPHSKDGHHPHSDPIQAGHPPESDSGESNHHAA